MCEQQQYVGIRVITNLMVWSLPKPVLLFIHYTEWISRGISHHLWIWMGHSFHWESVNSVIQKTYLLCLQAIQIFAVYIMKYVSGKTALEKKQLLLKP